MEQTTIERIEKSPFYKELIEQEKSELLTKRQAAAEALATIDAKTADRARGIAQTLQEAEKTCAECERAHQEAVARVNQLRTERFGLGTRAETTKNKHIAFLIETADTRIDKAIAWFNDRHDALRRGTAIQQTHRGGFDLLHMEREITTTSNHTARVKAMVYCRQAIKKLELMKQEPELDQKKLTSLAEKMPDPEMDFTETMGRKPERDAAHLPPWARLKSDDLHRLEMDTLLQKADSLKRKRA